MAKSKDSKNKLDTLTKDQHSEIGRWLEGDGKNAPQVVRIALSHYNALAQKLDESQQGLRSFLAQLRRALGITPSSEVRKSSGRPIASARDDIKRQIDDLLASSEKSDELAKWHKYLAKQHTRMSKEKLNKAKKLEDYVLTPEDLAESEQAGKSLSSHILEGEGAREPRLESPNEPFMTGVTADLEEDEIDAIVNRDKTKGLKIVDTLADERERFNFEIKVEKIKINVEKLVVEDETGETRIITASTKHIGPPRFDITWEFLANLCVLVAQYALPFNRIATMLTTTAKKFSASMLSKHFIYTADRFVDVYLRLYLDLAPTDVLMGDDTSVRVTEVSRYFKSTSPPDPPPPWQDYATPEKAKNIVSRDGKPPLEVRLAQVLPFVSERRTGDGDKTKFNTTVLHGRTVPDNPRSSIVFYRSHFGGFANLCEAVLKHRNPDLRNIWIQSDLATTNLVVDKKLLETFDIQYAGCASHARRPFAIHEDEDSVWCSYMLHMFKGLFIHEHCLDSSGRNTKNVTAVRTNDSLAMWQEIKQIAVDISEKWSKKTKLGNAARYIINNFEKLTTYLYNPRLSLTNNFSERMMRMEKMIESSALFRTSLKGRAALDIIRTIIQTCVAAEVNVKDYMLYVLKSDPEEVAANPQKYTPLAFRELP
jgi:hypothetical protein